VTRNVKLKCRYCEVSCTKSKNPQVIGHSYPYPNTKIRTYYLYHFSCPKCLRQFYYNGRYRAVERTIDITGHESLGETIK
jgi:nitroimidazol reductase NimA-like FMN-containing flavoprotein (pyridoxamine 5'-phosphate oxidase superfamily)